MLKLNPLTLLIKAVLYCYTHYVSLLFAPRCRFYPSCSRYAYQAVDQHGLFKGLYLTTRRLLKCHPWNKGGFDPIPEIFPADCCCDSNSNHPTSTQKDCLP